MPKELLKYVLGGIGDLLQTFDEAAELGNIAVFSHFGYPQEFYEPFEINFEFRFVREVSPQLTEELRHHEPLKRSHYPNIQAPVSSRKQAEERLRGRRRIIGIHPKGSAHSNEYWSRLGMPLKYLPPWFVRELIVPENTYLLFGTADELDEYAFLEADNVICVIQQLWDTFAHVELCNQIIAVDSAIKAYAAVRRIPSVVLVGDYEDKIRDRMFIDPYRETIKPIRFDYLNRSILHEVRSAARIGA